LPVGLGCCAAYALRAWLAVGHAISDRTPRFARWSATCSLALGMAGQVAFHLMDQVLADLADAPSLVIALDGKTVRGARGKDGKAPHLLAAMITGARAVIAQKDTDAKTNEITQVRPLLDGTDITGARW